jgi:TPP-dependent pyruvate/acetoin dehydrogenase alpha subunit
VFETAREALDRVRSGEGPIFLDVETYRMEGHYIGDAQVYRDKDELRRLRETRDPVRNLRERVELSDDDWNRLDAEAHRIVDAAVEFAKAGTDPDPADALKNVYADERTIASPRTPERRE